jgi:BirA family transcriptional regulator, biotin operon repressor / biotin---[acetyl-CoA-carboxylase] ligase
MATPTALSPFMAELNRGAEAAWLACHTAWPELTVEVVPQIDSTNTALMARARQGRTDSTLLIAAHQTAGRGRMGRQWEDQAGQALMFSLGLPLISAQWSGLSLAVGVSLAENLSAHVRLKWPNDLWCELAGTWHKLGGILIETASVGDQHHLVIGVGINLTTPTLTAGHAQATPACSLQDLGLNHGADAVLGRVVPALMADAHLAMAQGFAPFIGRFAHLDALRGQRVRLSDGREGVAEGVEGDGALRVNIGGHSQTIHSQEVSVRPC